MPPGDRTRRFFWRPARPAAAVLTAALAVGASAHAEPATTAEARAQFAALYAERKAERVCLTGGDAATFKSVQVRWRDGELWVVEEFEDAYGLWVNLFRLAVGDLEPEVEVYSVECGYGPVFRVEVACRTPCLLIAEADTLREAVTLSRFDFVQERALSDFTFAFADRAAAEQAAALLRLAIGAATR